MIDPGSVDADVGVKYWGMMLCTSTVIGVPEGTTPQNAMTKRHGEEETATRGHAPPSEDHLAKWPLRRPTL